MKRKVFATGTPHIIARDGLWGKEKEILKSMFSKDGKQPLRFKKLSSLQKKVARKMGYPKEAFLLNK